MANTINPLWTGSKGVRGGVLKQIVFKQYKHKTVVTKFQDMSNIIPTESQLKEKVRFSDAVIFAKEIIADPIKKQTIKELKDSAFIILLLKNIWIRNDTGLVYPDFKTCH